jgi:predicted ATP-binding protein involved in virulence
LWSETAVGIRNNDLKNWFVNRFMFSSNAGSLTELQRHNYYMAIECMSTMEPSVRFATVDASTFNIMVETNDGVIPMEFLSSGFRATFYTILGIIKEIELRKIPIRAGDFAGTIAIDEIDLHLHPTWQRQIARVLRTTFPATQFIMTTHSPHVIQAAESGEVIALVRNDEGRPTYNPLPNLPYGFQGWTVEEILEDVMRVPSTKSPLFETAIQNFDQALSEENQKSLAEHLGILEQMLHPKSPLRKLLRLQAAPVLG